MADVISKATNKMNTKRIFIAIKIANTDQILKVFRQVQLELKGEWIKWVDLDGLHITLVFLGATDIRKLELIKQKIKKSVLKFSSLDIQIKSIGTFPSIEKAKVLWLGVKADNSLFELREEIVKQLERLVGIGDKRFLPHVTIGRIKHGVKNPIEVKQVLCSYSYWKDNTIRIKEIVLMESVLSSDGLKYVVLEKFPFPN